MTREEAINYWEGLRKTFSSQLEKEEKYWGRMHLQTTIDAIDTALSALRQQDVPDTDVGKNEPLTMDELRNMDGEPVWVSVSNNWRESGVSEGWCLVRFHSEDDRVRVYIYDTRHGARFFAQQDYGISWFAYRQKPEEGTV